LEAFFKNGISYKVYAVADSKEIKTNSGITLMADDVVANLKGHEDEYDALVFSCGDAVPVFQQNADKPYNVTMLEVVKAFGEKGKMMIGHCAAAMMFDFTGVTKGKKVAVHPLAKAAIQNGAATDSPSEIDGNFYTAQDENHIWTMMPKVIAALKA
jgi:putative intracellular protease/amidase